MFTVPQRQTELARTADLHILYRRAASAYAGAITPEVKAELWAQAEKQVPPLKEKAMNDIEDARSYAEAHQTDPFENVGPIPTPPPTVDVDALVEAHESTPAPVDASREAARDAMRSGDVMAAVNVIPAPARVEEVFTRGTKVKLMIAPNRRRISVPVGEIGEVMSYQTSTHIEVGFSGYGIEVCKASQLKIVDADEPIEAHEPVAIERPGGDATVGTAVVNPKNPAPAGMVAVQVAPDMIEAAQADEVRRMEDMLNENTALKREIAELKVQLDALKSKPQIFPLGSKPTAQRIAHICPKITEKELEEAWGKRWSFYDSGWTVDPESGAVNYNVVFIETKETVEPKPDADKPGNVRDFPVPDAELSAEDDGTVSARASGLPVSASYGMGRGFAPRRA